MCVRTRGCLCATYIESKRAFWTYFAKHFAEEQFLIFLAVGITLIPVWAYGSFFRAVADVGDPRMALGDSYNNRNAEPQSTGMTALAAFMSCGTMVRVCCCIR